MHMWSLRARSLSRSHMLLPGNKTRTLDPDVPVIEEALKEREEKEEKSKGGADSCWFFLNVTMCACADQLDQQVRI